MKSKNQEIWVPCRPQSGAANVEENLPPLRNHGK